MKICALKLFKKRATDARSDAKFEARFLASRYLAHPATRFNSDSTIGIYVLVDCLMKLAELFDELVRTFSAIDDGLDFNHAVHSAHILDPLSGGNASVISIPASRSNAAPKSWTGPMGGLVKSGPQVSAPNPGYRCFPSANFAIVNQPKRMQGKGL